MGTDAADMQRELRAHLDDKLRGILGELLADQRFLVGFVKDAQTLLSCVSHGGYQIALVLLPDSASAPLTKRQNEVAALVGRGLGNKGIARELGISEQTVAVHLKSIYKRWGIHSRAALARCAAVLLR